MAGLLPSGRTEYEHQLARGAAQYSDVVEALRKTGLAAEFTQTGGMCAAIMVPLDGGHYLLLTDLEDTLSWDRVEHSGWWVGIYEPEEKRTADGPLRWLDSVDGSPAEAVRLAREVLRTQS